jgi:hypothetical protein
MQQSAGFMVKDEDNDWYCTRPSNLYEGITCPEGHFRRSELEFQNGCKEAGLNEVCDQNPNYDCFCKPCVQAYDVDVYQHEEGTEDLHLVEYYGDSLPGCEKMSICGTIQQGQDITLRIHDNMQRDNAQVTVVAHAGEDAKNLQVVHLKNTYAYEIHLSEKRVGVQVLEIQVNGEPISQSPIRVMVEQFDCDSIHGIGSRRVPDEEGKCICANNTYKMGDTCLESEFFLPYHLCLCLQCFRSLCMLLFAVQEEAK